MLENFRFLKFVAIFQRQKKHFCVNVVVFSRHFDAHFSEIHELLRIFMGTFRPHCLRVEWRMEYQGCIDADCSN